MCSNSSYIFETGCSWQIKLWASVQDLNKSFFIVLYHFEPQNSYWDSFLRVFFSSLKHIVIRLSVLNGASATRVFLQREFVYALNPFFS